MSGAVATLESLLVDLSGLKLRERNPRRGRVDVVKESLMTHGQYRPIVVNARTDEVLAGNHTVKAARELGWAHIAATYVDVDEEEATRIMLVDNRASDLATNDDQILAELLTGLDGLQGTGYAPSDLDEILTGLGGVAVGSDNPADTEPQLGPIEYRLVVLCRDESEQATWLEQLQAAGLQVTALAQ